MGFWHTGKWDQDQPTGLGDYVYVPSPPERFVCEQCRQDFAALDALRKHRFEAHPQRQPVLLLRGLPIGEQVLPVVAPLQVHDVAVDEATHCVLNGRDVAPALLGSLLAVMRREFVELELSNPGVAVRCRLDFQIPNEEDLLGVEAAFGRLAHAQALSLEAVSRFTQECRGYASAKLYYDGISHYLYGVMAKERSPSSGLRHEQYSERYLRASEALAGFERPLARSIRALVAFHFNHFHDAEVLAGDGALRHTAGAYAALLQGMPWHLTEAYSPETGGAVEDLLTDQETLQILDDASRGLLHLKANAPALLVEARRMSTGYDRLKRQLLAGEALAATDDDASHVEARKLARELVGQADAGPWAEALLKRMKK